MTIKALGVVISCVFALGACTTLLTTPKTITLSQTEQTLPVKSMADALVTRFLKRGWTVKVDPVKQTNRLFGLISRGWDKVKPTPAADPTDIYLATLGDAPAATLSANLLEEIALATTEARELSLHVGQSTTQINSEQILRAQVLSLEQAVLATRKAKKLFASAVTRAALHDPLLQTKLQDLNAKIDVLTEQTDTLNQRRQASIVG